MYAPFFDERDARELQGAQSDPLRSRQENWVRFAKTAAPVLTALPWRLPKAHTGPVTVLVNELDADVCSRASSFSRIIVFVWATSEAEGRVRRRSQE